MPLPNDHCYFTISPRTYDHHHSRETPSGSPSFDPAEAIIAYPKDPILAHREAHSLSIWSASMASNFMSVQTTAAHKHSSHRPRPYPMQNVLHVTSDDSSTSSSDDGSPPASLDSHTLARCSRCQRTPSIDVKTGKSNMVSYGLNLWYCSRCAALVGLPNR